MEKMVKILGLLMLLLLPGCCGEQNPDSSSLPWSRPAGWENSNSMGIGATSKCVPALEFLPQNGEKFPDGQKSGNV